MSCEGAVELSSTEAAGAKTFINQLVKELGRIKLEPLAVLVESHHFARVRGETQLSILTRLAKQERAGSL